MKPRNRITTVLSIAGVDPCAGAGLLADMRVCAKSGVYGLGVASALTAQNTSTVNEIKAVSAEFLESQLSTLLDDIKPDAVKIGMLPTSESIVTVSNIIKKYKLDNIVIDPVMISSSGTPLVDNLEEGIRLRKQLLFPLASLITPNTPEFKSLDMQMDKIEYAVLLKGGHSDDLDNSCDVLLLPDGRQISFDRPRVKTINTHGTGCVLSSSIACQLALGLSLNDAVRSGKQFITESLLKGKDINFGKGNGPALLL